MVKNNKPVSSEKKEPFSNKEYTSTLAELKKQIQECQVKAITAVNRELISLYWIVGKTI